MEIFIEDNKNLLAEKQKVITFPFLFVLIYAALALGSNLLVFIPRIVFYILNLLSYILVFAKTNMFTTFGRWSKMCYSIVIFCLIIIVYFVLGISSASVGNICNQTSFFSFILLSLYVSQTFNDKQKRWLLIALLLILIPTVFTSIAQHAIYGDAINYLSDEELSELGYANSTNFNTAILLLLSWLYFSILNSKSKIVKLIGVVLCLYCCFYLFNCGSRGSIIIIMIIMLVILPIIRLGEINHRPTSVSVFVICFIGLVLLIKLDEVLDVLISISPDRLAYRFEDLKNTHDSGLTDSSLSGRVGLYKISIDSWLNNFISFIFGIGDHRGSMTGALSYDAAGIGGHSELIDSFARWGIFGCFFLMTIIKYLLNLFSDAFSSTTYHKQMLFIYVVFVYCFIFKSIFFPNVGCVYFLMGTLLFDVLIQKQTI